MMNLDLVLDFDVMERLLGRSQGQGRLLIVGGSLGDPGAPLLAARAALRAGIGLVTIAVTPEMMPLIAGKIPEAKILPLVYNQNRMENNSGEIRSHPADALLVGPGLPPDKSTAKLVRQLLDMQEVPVTMLASGAISAFPVPGWAPGSLFEREPRRALVLTPNADEFRAISGKEVSLDAVGEYAAQHHVAVVCQGIETYVSDNGGAVRSIDIPNPLVSVAGAGDVLAGLIGALLAGGVGPSTATRSGAVWHAATGAALHARLGGLLASELADELPAIRAAYLAARESEETR